MNKASNATIEDLYHVPENGKAEIVNGALVKMPPTGGVPGRAGGKIYRSLDDYEHDTHRGYAFPGKCSLSAGRIAAGTLNIVYS